jgi:uncharacterized membrane protein YesL
VTVLPISHGSLTRILDTAYLALMTNLLLIAACLPVVVVLLTTDPARSWGALALVLPLAAPAFTAATVVFATFSDEGEVSVVRTYLRAWRAHLRRSLQVGAAASAALVVLAVDIRAVSSSRVGAVAIPVFLVLAVLALLTAVLTLVAVPERPDVTVARLLRASLFLGLRRWYLSVASLVVLVLLATVTVSRPAIGLGLAAAPLLYVVWANSRFTLAPIRPATIAATPTTARNSS